MNNYNSFDNFNNTFLMQNNVSNSLYGPYEGYLKGNMFNNLYEQYKNYIPSNVKISNEKDEALFNLNQIGFAVHELNLYLDVYPDNQEALNLFSNYTRMYNQMLNDYQEKYGALKVNSVNGNSIPFAWVGSSFPWEVR